VIAALQSRLDEAAAELVRANLVENPAVAFERESPHDATRQTTWSLAWTLPLDGRRSLRVDAADEAVNARRGDVTRLRLLAREAARAAFADWHVAWSRHGVLVDHLSVVAEVERHVIERAAAGEDAGLDARRLALEVGEVKAQVAEAEAGLARARAEVTGWFPTLPAGAVPAAPSLPSSVPALDASARGDLAMLRAEKAQREIEVRLGSRVIPAPELSVGWQEQAIGDVVNTGPTFALSLPLPLFDHRQAERALARAQLARAEAELAAASVRAEAEIGGASAAYLALLREADNQRRSAGDIPRLIEGATQAYRLGEASLTDFLDSLRAALAGRLRAVDVLALALEGHRALEVAAGREVPSGGGE
jgi:cobalt-zinc-cadmium efflux system outer membrane protein